jgi:hypothetical protein
MIAQKHKTGHCRIMDSPARLDSALSHKGGIPAKTKQLLKFCCSLWQMAELRDLSCRVGKPSGRLEALCGHSPPFGNIGS